jgi:hypothetical protein
MTLGQNVAVIWKLAWLLHGINVLLVLTVPYNMGIWPFVVAYNLGENNKQQLSKNIHSWVFKSVVIETRNISRWWSQWKRSYGTSDCRCAILACRVTAGSMHSIIISCPRLSRVFTATEPCFSALPLHALHESRFVASSFHKGSLSFLRITCFTWVKPYLAQDTTSLGTDCLGTQGPQLKTLNYS